jgi:diacylglycerol kinase family enzyme
MKNAHLIANSRSGKGKGQTLAEEARTICDELGYNLIVYDTSHDFEQQVKLAVQKAQADGGVVIAAGGDGTIRTVAQEAAGKPVRFAAVPVGTFNFFARNHRISEDHLEAFRLALTAETRPVRLGEINGHFFLINASLGLYAKAIRERERMTDRFGRHRLVVIISTMMSMLDRHRLLKVDLVANGVVKTVHTPMIFIGNNALQLRDLKMDVARCMQQDLLAVVMMKPLSKKEVLRILWRGFTKTLEDDEKLETFCVSELTIYTRHSSHEIALDGEILRMTSPLRVRALPEILNLAMPPKEASP